jgi:predicted aspartyl protease
MSNIREFSLKIPTCARRRLLVHGTLPAQHYQGRYGDGTGMTPHAERPVMAQATPLITLIVAVVTMPLAWASEASSSAAPAAAEPDQPLYAVSTRLDRIGRIVAPVFINGQGPFMFMLDTGANRTVLSDEAVQRLGLATADNRIAVQGVNGRGTVPTVQVQRLDAGELRFNNVALPVLTGTVLDRVDGILGMDGLIGKKVTADFIRDRISIVESRGHQAPYNRIVVHGELISGRLMMIEGHVGHVPVKAIIDTGGMRTLGNPALQQALAAQRGHGELAYTTGVIDATDRVRLGELALSPMITLGDAIISNTNITYGDFEIFRVWGLDEQPALLIGMDVLGTRGS